jgi:methylmalonyl-CoA mutase N-terminal domain/subunit
MYRKDFWIMGQYSDLGNAEESNGRYKHLIARGDTRISIALDLPTQVGSDSEYPLVDAEIGMFGVAIGSLRELEILFNGIPLNNIRQIRSTAYSIAPIFITFFLALAEKKGVCPLDFSLLLQNDILIVKQRLDIVLYIANNFFVFEQEEIAFPGMKE